MFENMDKFREAVMTLESMLDDKLPDQAKIIALRDMIATYESCLFNIENLSYTSIAANHIHKRLEIAIYDLPFDIDIIDYVYAAIVIGDRDIPIRLLNKIRLLTIQDIYNPPRTIIVTSKKLRKLELLLAVVDNDIDSYRNTNLYKKIKKAYKTWNKVLRKSLPNDRTNNSNNIEGTSATTVDLQI